MGTSIHSSFVRDEAEANVKLSQLPQHLNEFVADISQREIRELILSLQKDAISLDDDETSIPNLSKFRKQVMFVCHVVNSKAVIRVGNASKR